jgi:hypothetical protein
MKKSSILLLIISTLTLSVCTIDQIALYGSISGVVKDAQTQQPLENVSVTLKPGGLTKVTGQDGSYSFSELEALEYTLTYTKPEYITATKESTVQARANNIVDVTLAPEPVIPILKTNVKSLDFGKDSETLSLEITNTGKGSLDWHIEHESTWFSCSPTAGSTTKEKSTVVITVNRKQMERGSYRQTFSIASNGGSEDITVTMEVASVNLAYEPLELDFGKLTASLSLLLTNKGTNTINYTVETLNNWIIPEKTSGKITTTDRLNVLVSRESLAAGEHNGSLIIKAGNDTYAVSVKMTIASNNPPVVSIDPVSNITANGATFSGVITDVGASEIKRHGFCLGTSPEPTVDELFFNLGNFSGNTKAFTHGVTNLQTETEYFVRAYAENANGYSYSTQVSFITSGITVTGVSLNKRSLSLAAGSTEQLIATVSPSNALNKEVSWESSSPSIATVSATGLVTGISNGSATITVTTVNGNMKANCNVTVTAPVSDERTGTTGFLYWKLSNGTLTISGTGEMPDYDNKNAPWLNYEQSISNIIIESGVTNIGNYAFSSLYYYYYYYKNIKSVTISNTVTKIGDYAFSGSSLESITIPNSVTDIGAYAFRECAFNTLVIPDNVTTIGDLAFSECQSLHTLTIGAFITNIGAYAFLNCRNLTKVSVKNPTPPTLVNTFSRVPIDVATLVVPKGSKAAYINAREWSSFGTIIEEE